MADDIIFSLDADGEGTLATIDEIDSALQTLSDSIAMVAENAGDLAAIDDGLATVAENSDMASSSMDGLDATLSALIDAIGSLTGEIDTLNVTMPQLVTATEDASASMDGLTLAMEEAGGAADETTGMLDGLQAAVGPLVMVGAVAAIAGGKLVSMGLSGQKGEALLRGMAGASQQDIEQLQGSALQLGETMDQASAGFYQVESAGYSGSAAIKEFTAASKLAEGGQASQADMMSGLTAIMHDYNAKADDATQYTDYMSEAIVRGKQSAQDFSTSIGPLASAGENVGISFNQVAAAEATMTQINPKVAQDSQQLTSLFNFLSPTMGGVATAAKKLGISFDEQKYSSEDLLGKLQYLADISGGTNTAAFVKLTGGVRGSTAAIDLLKNGASSFIGNLDAMKNSAGSTQAAFDQFEGTIPSHLDKVGSAFSIFGTKLMDAIGPKVNPIIDKFSSAIGSMSTYMTSHIDIVMPVLAGLAVMVGVILVAAFTALAVPVLIATWPILAIAAAIGLLVTGVILLARHWDQIISALSKVAIIQDIAHAFQEFGQYIASLFLPIWQQLVNMWQTKIMPLFAQFAPVVEPIKTLFFALGVLIATGPVVVFGILIGIINGLIRALAGVLSGLVTFIGGVIKLFAGIVQVISGIVAFIVDLVTGHFNKLGADLGVVGQGIINIFTGMWDMVKGAFQAAIGFVVGLVSGFIDGIIGFFTMLWDKLVGHSIIPDMINGILAWFGSLPGKVLAFILSLVQGAIDKFNSFKSSAIQVFTDLVTGIQNAFSGIKDFFANIGTDMWNGIKSGINFIIGGINGFINAIDAIHIDLPKVDVGPIHIGGGSIGLPHINDIPLLAEGGIITSGGSAIVGDPYAPEMVNLPTGASVVPLPAGLNGSNDQTVSLLRQIAQSLVQLVQQSKNGPANLTFNNTQAGATNTQQLNQLIQALSGYGYESTARGGF